MNCKVELVTAWTKWNFENAGLRNGKNVKSAWQPKMVMLYGTKAFCHLKNLCKWYAPERKIRVKNGGLSRGTYLICNTYEVPPVLRPHAAPRRYAPDNHVSRRLWHYKFVTTELMNNKLYNAIYIRRNNLWANKAPLTWLTIKIVLEQHVGSNISSIWNLTFQKAFSLLIHCRYNHHTSKIDSLILNRRITI